MSRPIAVDPAALRRRAVDLVAIDSVNPSLVEGAAGEAEIAARVATELAAMGLEVERLESTPGRPSVVGRLAGSGGGRSLAFNAHLDTVDAGEMERPFEPLVEAGRLYGRGAYDMKGSLAACLSAAEALARHGERLAGDVLVAAVADEEWGSLGTTEALAAFPTDGAIVTEPTELELCVAHKGFVWVEVETRGRAAHGSRFEDGVDANLRMGRFLAELEVLEREVRSRRPHPLVGPPSLHAAILRGGTGLSTYAARCRLDVERRTIPGETPADVEAEIAAIADRLRARDSALEIETRIGLSRDPFETAPGSPLAEALEAAGRAVLGRPPPRVGRAYWMDAALYGAAGVDTAVIGPAGAGAHAAVEWVDLDSCVRVAEILARVALDWCGPEGGG